MNRDTHDKQESHANTTGDGNDVGPPISQEELELFSAFIVFVPAQIGQPLFALGDIVATRGAVELLDRLGVNGSVYLKRHQFGDWGVVCAEDATENVRAVTDGNRILSEYRLGGRRERLWIITEHDRSVTTLLLPDEY
ncbi:hypothetical protein ACIPF8_22805 [Collimonas sp. NPDC087041]|uniref:hypothetical protein n=1 Tax=Collimonas sp. NPDC087041 TaxID=3363960 RepID=UPI00381BE5B5